MRISDWSSDVCSSDLLVKGGHLAGAESPDVLAHEKGLTWFEAKRTATRNTHGTGCTLSSAIAAELGKGVDPVEAVGKAKRYLELAIARSGEVAIGSGHGPVHHFHDKGYAGYE